jgi:hypothetical protein
MQGSLMDMHDLQQIFIINLRKLGDDSTIISVITQKKCNNIYGNNNCVLILVPQPANQRVSVSVDWRHL